MENLSYLYCKCPCEILSIDPRYPNFCKVRYIFRGTEKFAYSIPYKWLKKNENI